MWLPLYVALHPVRIHPGLLKMSRESPRESHVRTGRVFSFEFFAVYQQTVLKRAFARFVHLFFLYFNIIKDQLMEATNHNYKLSRIMKDTSGKSYVKAYREVI